MFEHNVERTMPLVFEVNPDIDALTEILPQVGSHSGEFTAVIPRIGDIGVVDSLSAESAESPTSHEQVQGTGAFGIDLYAKKQLAHIAWVRQKIGNVKDEYKPRFETYLADCARLIYADPNQDPAIHANKSRLDWLTNDATDEEVGQYIGAHARILAEQAADPELAQAVREQQNKFIRNIRPWVARGRYSEDILDRVRLLQRAKFMVGDFWDSLGLGGNMELAYVPVNTNHCVISQGSLLPEGGVQQSVTQAVEENLPHEADHILNGWHMPNFAAEALAEHNAMTMREDPVNDQFEIIDPEQRQNDSRVNMAYRGFIHKLSHSGALEIPIETWTKGHSASGKHSPDYLALEADFYRAWGVNLKQVDKMLRGHEAQFQASHPNANDYEMEQYGVDKTMQELLDRLPQHEE
jgi:hypothetical protein